MIEAIVFDFDGVIVDSEPLHHRAFGAVFEPLGLTLTWDEYLRDYIGFDDRDAIRFAYERAGIALDPERLAELIDAKAAAFARVVEAGVDSIDGAVALIEHAAGRLPIAIASGALRADIELILPRIGDGLIEKFSAIVAADDVSRSKPDPETYAVAAKKLGVPPARCVAIEDTAAGIESAAAAGLRTLAVTNTCPADKLARADRVVDTLAGLTVDQLGEWFSG